MGFVLDEIWDWIVFGAYRKFGWRGAAIAILAPIVTIASIISLVVVLVNG